MCNGLHGWLKVEALVLIILLWSAWSSKNRSGVDASRMVIVYSTGITVVVVLVLVVAGISYQAKL
jgi:hypothetical protein